MTRVTPAPDFETPKLRNCCVFSLLPIGVAESLWDAPVGQIQKAHEAFTDPNEPGEDSRRRARLDNFSRAVPAKDFQSGEAGFAPSMGAFLG